MNASEDRRWLAAAAALSERARPPSRPNPAVGAIIVKDGVVVGRGWTQPGGRPHAEVMALSQAGPTALGATLYVSLEPCAHRSARGPACADLAAASGLARVIAGTTDPDPRTAGQGLRRLLDAGVDATALEDPHCRDSLAGFLSRQERGRPFVTLKLATSLDGCIALPSGESRWITGAPARAHAHRERARHDAILVGGGTLRADDPVLDVRLPGLEQRRPERWLLSRGLAPTGWQAIQAPEQISKLAEVQYLLVEGGAHAAAAFVSADLVDRLLLYRAPVLIGGGKAALADIGLTQLAVAHGRWRRSDVRQLGSDTLEIFTRTR